MINVSEAFQSVIAHLFFKRLNKISHSMLFRRKNKSLWRPRWNYSPWPFTVFDSIALLSRKLRGFWKNRNISESLNIMPSKVSINLKQRKNVAEKFADVVTCQKKNSKNPELSRRSINSASICCQNQCRSINLSLYQKRYCKNAEAEKTQKLQFLYIHSRL